jgi:DNA repair protein RecN (Recombination protein N)
MLRRLVLKDFIIVDELDLDWSAGFTALTGETGAGKSILIDALQLTLGSRGDASVVREGATRADLSAEFDPPASLRGWLEAAGLETPSGEPLRVRRVIDAQGKSRAWINGVPASVAQLREAAEQLVEIHGQHAWQSLTRPAAVRALLDEQAGVDGVALEEAWAHWRQAQAHWDAAQSSSAQQQAERERLAWQLAEVDKLQPLEHEWAELNSEHRRLSHAQGLLDAAHQALADLSESEPNALSLTARAAEALARMSDVDPQLAEVASGLREALAPLQDAAHTLNSYLGRTELDPQRLQALDERLAAWMGLARRLRCPPAELHHHASAWREQLQGLDAAADLEALGARVQQAWARYQQQAQQARQQRSATAPELGQRVSAAIQKLGMGGGRFEVLLQPSEEAQSWGMDHIEFAFAGHEGSSARPLAKVASGGELSRLALAIAVSTRVPHHTLPTLIFDEIDAGVGGAVAQTVGCLMRELASGAAAAQVLAVTHLPQVAASAHQQWVVSKGAEGGRTLSRIQAVTGPQRVQEIARMLGGSATEASLAHAQELLQPPLSAPERAP